MVDHVDTKLELRSRRRRGVEAAGAGPQSRLEATLRQRIFQGQWASGTCLPSARALADEFGVSHSTVKRTLAFLHREGLLVGRQGKGHFVAGRPPRHVTGTVAVVTSIAEDLEHRPTIQQLAGIRATLNEDGYNLSLVAFRHRVRPPRHFSVLYEPKPIIDVSAADAAIVLGVPDGYAEPLYTLARYLPVVCTSYRLYGPGLGSVMADYTGAVFRAVRHLAELGHRDIAHIALDDRNLPAADQREGARLALFTLPGVRVEPLIVDEYLVDEGEKAARALLARPKPPTAVVCGSSELALGFWRVAADLGIAIPERISLVGVTDCLTSADLPLPLTALHVDFPRLGREIARMALDLAARPDQCPQSRLLEMELRVRASTQAPPA